MTDSLTQQSQWHPPLNSQQLDLAEPLIWTLGAAADAQIGSVDDPEPQLPSLYSMAVDPAAAAAAVDVLAEVQIARLAWFDC